MVSAPPIQFSAQSITMRSKEPMQSRWGWILLCLWFGVIYSYHYGSYYFPRLQRFWQHLSGG